MSVCVSLYSARAFVATSENEKRLGKNLDCCRTKYLLLDVKKCYCWVPAAKMGQAAAAILIVFFI